MKRTTILTLTLILLLIPIALADVYYVPYIHQAKVVDHPEFKPVGILGVDTYTGAGSYNYQIKLPKGTNDLTPQVTLSYNSHLTYQRPSVLGTGWVLSSYDYIQRNTNYSFDDTDDDFYDLYFHGRHYELVYVADEDRYHTEEESFFYIEKDTTTTNDNGEYWVLKTKDGTTYRFGYNDDSEMVATEYSYTWRWSLDLVTDTHDNNIYYTYQENPDSDDSSAVYPYQITYNNDEARIITFELEDRDDIWTGYYDGTYLVEAQRISAIEITVNSDLVHKYIIGYEELGINTRYGITSIHEYGSDDSTALPEINFEYEEMSTSFDESSGFDNVPEDATFTNTNGDEEYGVRFGDFNGDGLLDLIKSLETCSDDDWCHGAWLNTGFGWEESESFTPDDEQAFVDYADGSDLGVRVFDVNCDGMDDLVKDIDCSTDDCQEVWLSNGDGFEEDEDYELSQDAAFVDESGVDYGTQIADINGDGNLDVIRSSPDYENVWLNTCSGWEQADEWLPSEQTDGDFDEAVFVNSDELDNCVRVLDLNGDHLSDMIRITDEEALVWLNTGSGWKDVTDEGLWIPDSGDEKDIGFCDADTWQDTGSRPIDVNGDGLADVVEDESDRELFLNNGQDWTETTWADFPEVVFAEDGENFGTRIVDVNGDGRADIVQARGTIASGVYNVMINNNKYTFLLKSITNEIGATQEIEYVQSTNMDNTGDDDISDLNFNMWLIENRVDDSGQTEATTEYNYEGGYYNTDKKEFRGFYHVTEEIEDTIIEHYYHQDSILQGKEESTSIYDSDESLYQITEYSWDYTEQDNYAIVFLNEEQTTLYDSDDKTDYKQTGVSYTYDDYGNIKTVSYEGDTEKTGDERSEEWEYVVNEGDWIVNAPMTYTKYDEDNNLVAESYYIYDEQSYGDAPTIGDLTKEEAWLEDDDNPTIQYSYNSYGNLIEETDPNEGTTTYDYGTTETTYTYPDTITNAVGHSTDFEYDLGTGNVLSETDSNGIETAYDYDVFGRITKEISTYDSDIYPTKEYEYNQDGEYPESILVKQRESHDSSGTFDVYYFYDGFGNLIELKEEAEDSQQRITTMIYDGLGRVVQITNPYLKSASENYVGETAYTTTYMYDPLNNVVNVENPDGTSKTITFDVLDITVEDESSNSIKYSLDAYGQITEITEDIEGMEYTTLYSYNSEGRIEEITDSDDNTFTYTYDELGRKTSMDDTDVGEWSYEYDANSNIITQTDARGIVTDFTYDDINRLLTKTTDSQSITHTYDEDYDGTLSTVETDDVTTSYNYDDKLRLLSETTNIDSQILTTEYEYDAADRIKSKALTDGTQISYDYNNGNLVEAIGLDGTDIVEISYTASKLPETRTYANSVISSFDYDDASLRLEQIQTDDVQDISYVYDNVGNIIEINDASNSLVHEMNYDNINRLTDVTVTEDETEVISYKYVYDAIGNILSVTNQYGTGFMDYDIFPAHAPLFSIIPSETSDTTQSVPTHDTPLLTSSYGTDTTNEDLTVNPVNTEDSNGDDVKNIIAWYKDEEPYQALYMSFDTESLNDYSGNDNTATSTATYTEGYNGFGAYDFEGTEGITVADSASISMTTRSDDVIVVSAWINSDSGEGPVFMKKGEYGLVMNSKGSLVIYSFGDNSDKIGSDYNDGDWHHVVAKFNEGESYSIYVDGNLIKSVETTDTSYAMGSNLEVGAYETWGTFFEGMIDELMIFTHDLSDEQITALYDSYVTGDNPFETIDSEETSIGDNWYASVTPTDSYNDGETKNSNEITIISLNSPTHDTPLLTSSDGTDTTNEDLTVTPINTEDADGDEVKNIIAWYKDSIPYQSLYLPFDTGSSDYSGNENEAATTAMHVSDGISLRAYKFNGAENIIIQDNPSISMTASNEDVVVMSAWIKTTSTTGLPIFIKKGEYGLTMGNTGSFNIYSWGDNSGRIGSGYNDGVWHHITAKFKESESYSIYVDGVLINTVETTDTSYAMGYDLEIGSHETNGAYFEGVIDEVIVFMHDVSDEQITALYDSYVTGDNPFETIYSEETSIGDNWYASVTPTDGYNDGETKDSNSMTIS